MTSTDATCARDRPRSPQGVRTMSGTWTVASYTKKVWVFSPWSPRLSPWSAMSTSTVSSQTPAAFSHATSRPTTWSVYATSPR